MQKLIFILILISTLSFIACEETEEAVDENSDIIIRNTSDFDLWIMIDGVQRGDIDNDGIGRTLWDGIPSGDHTLQAYVNNNYTGLHCEVETGFLDGNDDFYWYLEDNERFSGTKSGNCD